MALTNAASYLSSIGCVNLLIWIAGVLLMTGLTIKDFIPLLDDYRSNNIATQVGFARDSNFTPPQFSLSIPFCANDDSLTAIVRHLMNDSEECSICEMLETNGWAIWKEVDLTRFKNDGFQSLYLAMSLNFVKKLTKNMGEDKKNPLDKQFYQWNSPLLMSAINFFTYWDNTDVWLEPRDFEGTTKNDLIGIMDSFNNTTTMDLLHAQVMKAVCQHMVYQELNLNYENWSDLLTNTTCEDLLLNQNTPVTFNRDIGIWFGFPRLDIPTQKTYHFNFLESNVISWVPSSDSKSYYIFPHWSVLYDASFDSQKEPYIYQTVSQGRGLNITVRYSVQVRARDGRTGRSACKRETMETCSTKCTKQMIIDRCNCVPFTFKRGLTYDHKLPYCNYAIYTVCNLTKSILIDINGQCSDKCQETCEFTSYNWQVSSLTFDPLEHFGNRSEFNLILLPLDTSFTEFTWIFKNTPEQFLSQMGGLVNFYLGFSGLSLVQFIILCIDFLRQRLFFRRERMEEKKNMEPKINAGMVSVQKNNEGDQFGHSRWATSRGENNECKSQIFAVKNQIQEMHLEIMSQIFVLKNQMTEIQSEMRRSRMGMNKNQFK